MTQCSHLFVGMHFHKKSLSGPPWHNPRNLKTASTPPLFQSVALSWITELCMALSTEPPPPNFFAEGGGGGGVGSRYNEPTEKCSDCGRCQVEWWRLRAQFQEIVNSMKNSKIWLKWPLILTIFVDFDLEFCQISWPIGSRRGNKLLIQSWRLTLIKIA